MKVRIFLQTPHLLRIEHARLVELQDTSALEADAVIGISVGI